MCAGNTNPNTTENDHAWLVYGCVSLSPSLSPDKMTVLLKNGGSKRMESHRPHPIGLRSWHPHGYRAFLHVLCSLEVAVDRARCLGSLSSLRESDILPSEKYNTKN